MQGFFQTNIVSILALITTTVGALIIHSVVLIVQWTNMKRDIKETKENTERELKDIKDKVNRMDEGHDRRLGALETTLNKIEVSTGKIETKVELILTYQDK